MMIAGPVDQDADEAALSGPALDAFRRVRDDLAWELETGIVHYRLGLSAAEKPRVIRSFERTPREEAELDDYLAGTAPMSEQTITDFVCFGYPTARGFQRQPNLAPKGYHLVPGLSKENDWMTWEASL